MLFLYNIIINIFYFIISPYGKIRALQKDPFWQGRMGRPKNLEPVDLWFHAASMGEVRVIGHLIRTIEEKNDTVKMHLTVMTRAGFKTAHDLYHDILNISYFPYDRKNSIAYHLQKLSPKAIVIAETEIWPNLVIESSLNSIPIVLVNGRLSDKAMGRYKIVKKTMTNILSKYDKLFVKSQKDFENFLYFTKDDKLVSICGDMKFDAPLLDNNQERVNRIKDNYGINRDAFIITAGSTREGEEDIISDVYQKLKAKHPETVLILAPRHLERLESIRSLLNLKNIEFKTIDDIDQKEPVILVTKFGILNDLYLISDLAFVGGTLVDLGGQNILEPVWAKKPVLFGPSVYNIRESVDYVIKNNFGAMVNNGDQLFESIDGVRLGNLAFNIKSSHDMSYSAAEITSKYILQLLNMV